MTKEALIKYRNEAEAERERLVAQANMLNGVIHATNYWLDQLTNADSVPHPDAEPNKA